MCVQDDFLCSKSKWSTARPLKHGIHIQLLNGNMILSPTFHTHDWQVTTLHWEKNGWRCTSDVRWASWLAFVFVFVHVFGVWVWEIEGRDNGARRFTCRDKIVLMFLDEKEKDKVNAVGTYHATFLISLEASCLFFLISDFTTALGNQPVILFFCGCR